ncbi:hypothetical protein PCASD_24778 [Puccinia coronata f. sp. avenae]|uniref:Uncharacterized protein n=1 Tax=Puccinia coronata f. sp. avenae TaxID=200324 RepID=A0A2N5S2H0_9BASI|nr:hypothetical protein PCASD_24778 [Puccinia coronata f. sp. avenae]
MDNPISPMFASSSLPPDSRSPSQPRSPWSSLMSPTPNRGKFPSMVLANLIRHKPNHSNSLPSPCLPNSTTPSITSSGEDLTNFVWDIGSPSESPRRTHEEEELFQIARMYQPSVGKRTRPTPQPIMTRRDLLPLNAGAAPETATLTPTLPSAGAFKNSIHKLLRKRTAMHLKNSSQSSSSTTSPSETSADPEDRMDRESEETSDDEYRSTMGYPSSYMYDDPFSALPLTPALQNHTGYSSPLAVPRTPARGRIISGPLDEQYPMVPAPLRSSSMGK